MRILNRLFASRTVLAFVIAPISPGLLVYILWVFSSSQNPYQGTFFLMFSSFFAYSVAIINGIPLYLFVTWRRWNNLIVYIVGGVLLGSITFLIPILISEYSTYGLSGMTARLFRDIFGIITMGIISREFTWFGILAYCSSRSMINAYSWVATIQWEDIQFGA